MNQDRNHLIRKDIITDVDRIEQTDHLMRIRRLVRWCVEKEV